tara:strand:- start:313 stop:1221 length:909 start_codon:yes stop_codon:yes gene_type:complete
MKKKTITLLGGSGFLAKYCISELLKDGHKVIAVCRNPYLAGDLRMMGPLDQLDVCSGNIVSKGSIEPFIRDSDIVINLVGILFESSGNQTFQNCHTLGAKNIAELSKKHDVERLIHFSSIGANIDSESKYQQSKGLGEKYITEIFPNSTIIRPSIVFGPGDGFFSVQSRLVKMLPVIPLFGGGNNRFQCVYVKDLALGLSKIIESKESRGQIFEFGGPDILSMKEIYKLIMNALDVKRLLFSMPLSLAAVMGTVMQYLPSPIITYDQVKLLRQDNIVSEKKNTLESLGVAKQSVKDLLQTII